MTADFLTEAVSAYRPGDESSLVGLAIAQQLSRIADALTRPTTGGVAPSVAPEAAARLAGSARAAEEAARVRKSAREREMTEVERQATIEGAKYR